MNRVVIHCDACCDGVTCVACAVTSTGVTVPATNMSRNMQYNSFDTNLLDCSRERVWQHQRGTNTARSRRPLSGKNHEYFGHSDAYLPALTSERRICPLSRIAGIKGSEYLIADRRVKSLSGGPAIKYSDPLIRDGAPHPRDDAP